MRFLRTAVAVVNDVIAKPSTSPARILAALEQRLNLIRDQRLGFFGGVVAECAGFMDLGGELLNPRHHPPLLRQGRQGDFEREKTFFAQSNAIGCSLTGALAKIDKVSRAREPLEKFWK